MKNKRTFKIDFQRLYELFWIFIFGCVFGCFHEIFLHFIRHGEIVSRTGLVFGQFNPVYGIGAIAFTLCLSKVKNLKIVFIASMGIGGMVEYICSLFQEKTFGTISWDYSQYILNFQGRTSIFHMAFWGILGVVFFKWIYPFILKLISPKTNKTLKEIITIFMLVFMVFNILISYLAAERQNKRYKKIPPSNKIEYIIDNWFPDSRMDKIYPNKINK